MSAIAGSPSLLRRLAAMFYDAFLLVAVWIVTFGIFTFVAKSVTGDAEFTNFYLNFPLLELITFLFYGWFWTHGGQTLGMRAWRMKVVKENGEELGWSQALVRYLYAHLSWMILGIGFLMVMFNANRLALHDQLSHTHIELLDKKT